MIRLAIAITVLLTAASCGKKVAAPGAPTAPPPASGAPAPTQQVFQVRGVVQELDADGRTVKIKHEAIPGYMPAMVMNFEVKDTNELRGLQPADSIEFRLNATETDGWIDQVKKLGVAGNTVPAGSGIRLVRDVEPLNIGDPLPEYRFTNELGQAVSTHDFTNQAVAFTFIFTRCPFSTACPKMSSNFAEAQKKLLAMTNGPANWRLLTISFDPEFDTPAVLKAYAQLQRYDPKHWSFLTGALIDLTAIAEQVGLYFWRQDGSIGHNMRTVVVDARGRVQKIFPENKWNSDELVEELVKAAAR